jgi:hypothetical protein
MVKPYENTWSKIVKNAVNTHQTPWSNIFKTHGHVPKPVLGGLDSNRKEVAHRVNILVVIVLNCTSD